MSERKNGTLTRRQFATTAAMAALGSAVAPRRVFGGQAASRKLNIAAIGVGGMGAANLKACEAENIVALCDVDQAYAAKTFALYPEATVYTDYLVMLEKQKDIEAVIIATPDHTHAMITMACLRAGKHVYCQKPLTHTIAEARAIADAATKYAVVTQMGNQGHSFESIRLLKEWLDDGAIGNVTEVHAWTDRPVGGDPWSDFAVRARPTDTPPVPETLDWDKWLGPVAFRPYSPEYLPMKWRAWLDFGTGPLGDMGCHILDPAFWALELGPPQTIEATSTHYQPDVASETYPRASIVRYAFPARGSKPPVKLTWYDGRLLPPTPAELEAGPHAAGQRSPADRRQRHHPARFARRRRRPPDPGNAHAGLHAPAEDAAPGDRRPRGRLDPRLQGRAGRHAALFAVRVRRGAHADGAAGRARDPHEGSAPRVGQRGVSLHEQ